MTLSDDIAHKPVTEHPPVKTKKVKPGKNAVFHTQSDIAKASDALNALLDAAKASKSVQAHVIDLTPALATVLLDRNPANRKVKPRRVSDLARDISHGRWKLNGEPIIVSSDGLMNDGQHRCAAVIEANKAIQTMLIIGVSRESQDTVDHGAARSPGDDLALHGYHNTVALASSARLLFCWRTYGFITIGGAQAPTRAELMKVVNDNPGLVKSVLLVSGGKAKALGSPALMAFCHFAFGTVAQATDVAYFFSALIEGDNLKRGDPILNARNRLITDRNVLKTEEKVELLFKAWNSYRKGETARIAYRMVGGELPMLES